MHKLNLKYFSVLEMLIMVSLVCVILGLVALWGVSTLPYSLGVAGAIVGLLMRESSANLVACLAQPRVLAVSVVMAAVGVYAGIAIKYASLGRDLELVGIYALFAIACSTGWIVGKRIFRGTN